MKANELMIGDYVLFSGELKQVKSIVVSDNGVERIYVYGNTCQVSTINAYIQPIPLTPEILEKNGWEERPTGYVFYTNGKRYDNSLWYIFSSNTFVFNNAEFQINYVHQLQHALKLCGIEKTIEL